MKYLPMTSKKYISDYVILFIVLIVGMWQLVFGLAIMKWDAMDIYLPWKHFTGESLSNGILPLWNPFINSGFAQMGDPNTWYPVSWIISLVRKYDIYAVHFEYILHLYIAGIGFYRVAQLHSMSRVTRVIVSAAYMLSGFFISNAQHTGWVISAAWLPFIYFYFIQLKTNPDLMKSMKLGFCFFMMFTGGYPGIFISLFYLLLAFFVYFLFQFLLTKDFVKLKKWVLNLSLSALVFSLLSAVVIVSSLDLSEHITRGAGLNFDHSQWGILSGSLPPKALMTFLFSYAASINDQNFWGDDFSIINCYIGIIPLLVLIFINFQKNTPHKLRSLSILGISFILIAFAQILPFRKWLYLFLPLMNLFRFPALFRIFTIFFFLLAAGYGLDRILTNKQILKKFIKYLIAALVTLGVFQLFLLFRIEKWQFKQLIFEGFTDFDKIAGIKEKIFFQCSIFIGVMVLLILAYRYHSKNFRYYIIFISCIDMILATQMNIYATVADKFPVEKANMAFSNFPEDYPKPSLDLPMNKTNNDAFRGSIPYLWQNLAIYHKIPSYDGNSPYSFYTTTKAMRNKTYQAVISSPLLFLASSINKDDSIDSSSIYKKSNEKIVITTFNPNILKAKITIDKPHIVVFLQNYYPHWKAIVNGKRQPIVKTNDTFMSLRLDKGINEVTFEFRPVKVIYAFYISFSCLIIFIAFFLFHTVRNALKEKKYNQPVLTVLLVFIVAISATINLHGRHTNKEIYRFWDQKLSDQKFVGKNRPKFIDNIDDQSVLSKNTDHSDIQINNRTDLGKLVSKLENSGENCLFYSQINKIKYPDIKEIISDFYPSTLWEKDFGNSFFLYASKQVKEKKIYTLLSFNDFEKIYRDWTRISGPGDSTELFSGKRSLKLDSIKTYSPVYSKKFSEITNSKKCCFRISVYSKFVQGADPIIVFSTKRKDKNVIWYGETINQYCYFTQKWSKAYLVKQIDSDIMPNDMVEIYVWNNSKKSIWIDDFKIEVRNN
jgi:hypothetical protein